MLRAELGEVGCGRRRIGFEVEAVPGIRWRRGLDCDFGGALVEVAPEFAGRVTESQNAAGYTAPIDPHRINDRAENPKRVCRIEAIRNGENIKHRADPVNL